MFCPGMPAYSPLISTHLTLTPLSLRLHLPACLPAAERETRARRVYERALRGLRESQPNAKEEAVMLLEAWRAFESACTSRPKAERKKAVAAVAAKMPRRVKRKRPIVLDDGSQPGGMEEYYDYIFPVSLPGLRMSGLAGGGGGARLQKGGSL